MTNTLLVPDWMTSGHWAVLAVCFWALTWWAWHLFRATGSITSLIYGVLWSSAAMIATSFFLIQSRTLPIDPVWLFALERAFWWPLLFAAAALTDIHAAQLNGHRSLIARLDRLLRKDNMYDHSAK